VVLKLVQVVKPVQVVKWVVRRLRLQQKHQLRPRQKHLLKRLLLRVVLRVVLNSSSKPRV
jgi:hypothetical protein